MLVTPLRDGMNLVAKEYVASRIDATGALVLSEFAGAARELHNAILVNPHDLDGIKDAIRHVIDLDPVEAKARMRRLRRVVRRHDVYAWAHDFLAALQQPDSRRRRRERSQPGHTRRREQSVAAEILDANDAGQLHLTVHDEHAAERAFSRMSRIALVDRSRRATIAVTSKSAISETGVVAGSRPFATARTAMSRSVTIARISPSSTSTTSADAVELHGLRGNSNRIARVHPADVGCHDITYEYFAHRPLLDSADGRRCRVLYPPPRTPKPVGSVVCTGTQMGTKGMSGSTSGESLPSGICPRK